MAGPKYARQTDNGRYYHLPGGQQYVSVTNVLNEWSIPALAPAAAKETAGYFARNLPRAVAVSRRPDELDEFVREAKAHYRVQWEKKMDLGTRVHELAESHVLGKPMPDDEEAEPFLDQYLRWLDEFGVDINADIESAEITVVSHRHRYAGTADVWARLRFGAAQSPPHPAHKGRSGQPQATPNGLWLIDIKSSLTKPASALYRDMVLQLAALRYAETALLPDDSEVKLPKFAGVAILNLRTDDYGFLPLTDVADRDAHKAFCSLVPVAYFAHQLDLKPYRPVEPPARQTERKAS